MKTQSMVKEFISGTPLGDALLGDDFNNLFPSIEQSKKEDGTKKTLSTKEKKELKRAKYEEHYEQAHVILKWNKFQAKGIIPNHWQLFRNANTQYLSISSIAWSQQEGLVSGVPDLTCIIDNKILFIEMKRLSKKPKTNRGFRKGLNDAQLERFPKFEKCGFTPKICYSSQELLTELTNFTGIDFFQESMGLTQQEQKGDK